jgi:hypothetical protein
LAWKKTWASHKEKGQRFPAVSTMEEAGPGNLVSSPDVLTSKKCSCVSTPSDTASIFSSAEEELEVLVFKAQWGALTQEDIQHLEVLAPEEGSSTFRLPFSLGPDGDNALG